MKEKLKERLKHPYKRTSVIKVSEEITEIYLNLDAMGFVFGLIVDSTAYGCNQ